MSLYDIILTGVPEPVRVDSAIGSSLCTVFGLEPEVVRTLIASLPAPLARGVSAAQAQEYSLALIGLGVDFAFQASGSQSAQASALGRSTLPDPSAESHLPTTWEELGQDRSSGPFHAPPTPPLSPPPLQAPPPPVPDETLFNFDQHLSAELELEGRYSLSEEGPLLDEWLREHPANSAPPAAHSPPVGDTTGFHTPQQERLLAMIAQRGVAEARPLAPKHPTITADGFGMGDTGSNSGLRLDVSLSESQPGQTDPGMVPNHRSTDATKSKG